MRAPVHSLALAGTLLGLFSNPMLVSKSLAQGGVATYSTDTWERGIWDLEAVVLYYPWTVRRGFFIGGGPSYSLMWATVTDNTALQRHGWGVAAEMGYDIAPRSAVSLTPLLQYSYAWVGDIYYPLGSDVLFARGWKHEVVSLGLGVSLHERRRS